MEYLDSRDLEKELVELLELKEDNEDYDEDRLKELEELKEECEAYGWGFGITFIPEYEFEDYCMEIAYDCFVSDIKNNPLLNHVDWSSWAKACEMDYTSTTFDGNNYLWRES